VSEQAERDDGDRIRALLAVGFELRMMAHAAARLRQAPLADDDPMAQNADIDSAHLHARALIDFFLKESNRASDIRRTDFALDWIPNPDDAVERLHGHYRLLNKYLAHLTWERVSKDAPAWDYPNIADDVVDVADAWSKHLASANRTLGEVFRSHVDMARKTLSGER